jgi:hypothetical protein
MRSRIPALAFTVGLFATSAITAPAFAIPVPVMLNCTGQNAFLTANDISAGVGDQIALTNNSGTSIGVTPTGARVTVGIPPFSSGSTWTFEVESSTGGNISISGPFCGGAPRSISLRFSGGGGSSSGSASTSGPGPIFQQFGKPSAGTCDAAASESLNWSGVTGGGWGESWAEWMNGGLGGAVCTRTLVYSNALGKWVVV